LWGRRHEGYRRITRRLRDEGLVVNAKRVLRLMRADNLLSLRKAPVRPADQIRGNKNVGFSFHVFGFSFPLTLLLLPEILEILPPARSPAGPPSRAAARLGRSPADSAVTFAPLAPK